MLEKEEIQERRQEIVLYRCACAHCVEAEQMLGRLAKEFGARFEIKHVETDPVMKRWAGWRTPVVYINGRHVTHYQVNAKIWREALGPTADEPPSVVIGEIVDLHCYMSTRAKGEEHRRCAEECMKAGQPVGLLTRSGDLYLLIEDKASASSYEELKSCAGEEVAVTGDVRERGGVRSLVVAAAAIAT